MICGRCEKETREHKMSMFNTQELCPECQEKEKAHPDYKHACEVERDQALKGNRFFEGIGLPDDMKYKCIIGLRIGTRLCDLKDMAKLVEVFLSSKIVTLLSKIFLKNSAFIPRSA